MEISSSSSSPIGINIKGANILLRSLLRFWLVDLESKTRRAVFNGTVQSLSGLRWSESGWLMFGKLPGWPGFYGHLLKSLGILASEAGPFYIKNRPF